VQSGHELLRAEIEKLFASELDERDDGDRAVLLDCLDAAFSWPTWDYLRSLNGRSVQDASRVVQQTVAALLA
jgi:hypothetical protein